MSADNFSIAGVDVVDGLSRVRGNATLYKRLLLVLVNNAAEELKRWADALPPESERENVGNIAHKLKGGAANLSATALAAAAFDLEKAARDAQLPYSAVLAIIPQYLQACREFHEAAVAVLG